MFGFISNVEAKQIVYYGTAASGTVTDWQIWTKPSGINHVAFTIIGAGGGGAGYSSFGGGGGGSGGITQIIIPAAFLPDSVYMRIAGPSPGGVGTSGTVGQSTYISVYRSTSAAYILGYANGGGAGVNNSAGSGATAAAISNMPLVANFHYIARGGSAGGAGGNPTGTSVTANYTLSGGAGGSGTGSNGGQITGSGIMPTIPGGVAGFNGNGNHGIWFWKGFKGCGGSGGAVGASSIPGKGGNGAYGCGGGGGAGAFTASTGGDGGQGLVIIHYW